ncbi:hypothetical protein EVAR_69104_1 [Eumeta japonica]|uniref:TIL domain-containing protein n=1 Tax=Eumeta variegata TaxID=151549 RepID=A0A4C1SHQ1_EUMVA|nr:hypothetical protein EVAR_69104_1 [Eumeta japonica]
MRYLMLLIIFSICYAHRLPEAIANIECYKEHEVGKCVFDCPPEPSCKNRRIDVFCLQTEDMKCRDRCVCKDNYYRNDIGECVTEEQCG